jgi:RNA polymerase sigma-70 factor, ECF subfamily
MDSGQRDDLEREIRSRCEAGDVDGATSIALSGYGREIFELLLSLHRDEAEASDVFSTFSQGVWRGLSRFSWRSSFRTWAYVIAKRASRRHLDDARRRRARQSPFADDSLLADIEQRVRTETLSFLRTERRTRLLEIRDGLPPEDREFLMLRVDRELAWNDLAQILHIGDADLEGEALKREAARLRKRFQLLKEKIYELARREGLVHPRAP